jgi:CHAT domain-containing protein
VQSLANTVPGTKKILDAAFSLAATVPQLDDYTVVHFATHAAFVTVDQKTLLFYLEMAIALTCEISLLGHYPVWN